MITAALVVAVLAVLLATAAVIVAALAYRKPAAVEAKLDAVIDQTNGCFAHHNYRLRALEDASLTVHGPFGPILPAEG